MIYLECEFSRAGQVKQRLNRIFSSKEEQVGGV